MDTYRVETTDDDKVRVTFSRIAADGSTELVAFDVHPTTAREVGAAMVAAADHIEEED